MDVKKILKEATDNGASDIFIVAGRPLTYKSKGVMECLNEIRMIPKETFEFVTSIYALAERDISKFEETGDDDFSFAIPGVSRYRVSTFKQRALTLLSSVLSHSHCQSQAIYIYRTLLWSLRKQTTAWCWLPAQPEAVNLPHLHVLLIRSTMRRKSISSLLRIRLSFYIVMTNVLCHSVKSTQIQKATSLHFAPHSPES